MLFDNEGAAAGAAMSSRTSDVICAATSACTNISRNVLGTLGEQFVPTSRDSFAQQNVEAVEAVEAFRIAPPGDSLVTEVCARLGHWD